MHCPFVHNDKVLLLESIAALETSHGVFIITNQCNNFLTLMGKHVENIDPGINVQFLSLVARHVHNIYP